MPYSNLPDHAFWRLCREADDFDILNLFHPTFDITADMKIGTIGSCFAQHIGRYLKMAGPQFFDAEPPPPGVPDAIARKYGFNMFSARYGNVYTTRQLLQLVEDSLSNTIHNGVAWQKDGRFFDALRPNVEPGGLASRDEVREARRAHLRNVAHLFKSLDVLVFTLGLTETWMQTDTGQVFPTAPGTLAGRYNPKVHGFWNMRYPDVRADLDAIISQLRAVNPNLKFLFTVSPVPLTATASGKHVLQATTYSKSVLRAAAEDAAQDHDGVDYFPSFEIITGAPFAGDFYEENLRSVKDAGVDTVMYLFFASFKALAETRLDGKAAKVAPASTEDNAEADDLVCEEALLDAFAPR